MKANEMHYLSYLFDKVHLDTSTVHHQEYLNSVNMQYVFVILVLLASADTNRTRMTNMYCVYTVWRYS